MTEIPKDKISCKICKHRGESPISGACEGCNNFAKFDIDFDKVCKWCWNTVAEGDNICAKHRESHTKNSWPGCMEYDRKRLSEWHDILRFKKEYECSFEPNRCAVQDANGKNCPNEPKYRKKLMIYLCDDCFKNVCKGGCK